MSGNPTYQELTDPLRCSTLYGAFRTKILEFCIMHYLSFLDNLVRDFQYAFRSLRKDRRFVGTAVFALALGIGAATVAFSAFYNLLFNAFAAKDASRLVVLSMQNAESSGRPEFDLEPMGGSLADID